MVSQKDQKHFSNRYVRIKTSHGKMDLRPINLDLAVTTFNL